MTYKNFSNFLKESNSLNWSENNFGSSLVKLLNGILEIGPHSVTTSNGKVQFNHLDDDGNITKSDEMTIDTEVVGNNMEVDITGPVKGSFKIRVLSPNGSWIENFNIEDDVKEELKYLFKKYM